MARLPEYLPAGVLDKMFNGGSTVELVASKPVGRCGGCLAACGSCPFKVGGSVAESTVLVSARAVVRTTDRLPFEPRIETGRPVSSENSKCSNNPATCQCKEHRKTA